MFACVDVKNMMVVRNKNMTKKRNTCCGLGVGVGGEVESSKMSLQLNKEKAK